MSKLVKSDNSVITGTLGGIGDYAGIDPAFIRVGFCLLGLFSAAFPAILVYIILAICIPSRS